MHLINGQKLAATLQTDLQVLLKTSGLQPRLAVLLVGDDPASALYVKLKKKAAEEIGIQVDITHKDDTCSTADLIALIEEWNQDPAIDGILVQLPLPAAYDEQTVIDAMAAKKDADGFHPENIAALTQGNAAIIPPVHEGILRLISQAPVHVNGAHTVIIGNSEIFTKPLERLLTTAGSLVTRLGPDDLSRSEVKAADIVISAVGSARFIKPAHVKDGAVLIDVGTTTLENNKIAGDVDRHAFEETDCWITPVPGGVGPMTIAQLLWNVYALAKTNRRT
jgi:methylenetetrahydrofolate dehydrogenase (NADP+)/methenyltetrahydrofolate cyclohydrolase